MLELVKFRYILIIGTTPYELKHAPNGWDSGQVVSWSRDMNKNAVIREFSFPLQFVLEGAEILRSQYYQYGVEALVRLEILELNNSWQYDSIYVGELDFSNCTDTDTGFEINVMQGGLSKMIKANEKTEFEIDIDSHPNVIEMQLPGIGFAEQSDLIIPPVTVFDNIFYPEINVVNNGFTSGDLEIQNTNATFTFDPVDGWFMKVNSVGPNMAVSCRINMTIKAAGSARMLLTTYYGVVEQTSKVIYSISSGNQNINIQDLDFTITGLVVGQKFFIKLIADNIFSLIGIEAFDIRISYSGTTSSFPCKGLRAFDVLKELAYKVNNNNIVDVTSFLLSSSVSKWRNLIITSGDGIRSIQGAKIKTNLDDFFTSIDAVTCASFGIESDKIILEERAYAFNNNVSSFVLDDIKDINIQPASDLLYTSIVTGYEDQNYDKVDGRDEFNSQQEWKLPFNRITARKLTITSPYRADIRGIEEIRLNLLGTDKSTIDASYDNDVFMIMISDTKNNDDKYVPVMGSSYQTVTGVLAPNRMYNLDLTPKKNLLRHQGYLKSILNNLNGYQITFTSAKKNAELLTVDSSGVRVLENETIQVSDISGAMFIPVMVSFTTKYPGNIQELIKSNPYGYITFKYKGQTYKGFIMEVSSDLTKDSERDFTLLLANDNNLLNLIRK